MFIYYYLNGFFHYILALYSLLFSNLANAFIQSDLQIRKSKLSVKTHYILYIHTFKKTEKLNKMTNVYNNISKLNI